MRCSCQVCGTYMVQSESLELGCVCPECGQRCKQCLGTNSVVSRENLKAAAQRILMDARVQEEISDEYDSDPYRD
ncbi:MAG: hypothetical protein II875_06400 [Clostridia bacterium]|nr:hypothetical protein [Clostridia bacterium]